ncbi:hypothetical protein GCM10027614_19680 [Micromonospora vulcania]
MTAVAPVGDVVLEADGTAPVAPVALGAGEVVFGPATGAGEVVVQAASPASTVTGTRARRAVMVVAP